MTLNINIAGAGAGKTTRIADEIIKYYENCDKHRIVYCVAYTNNAAECIRSRIFSYYDEMPERIHVSTIHSFLYQELIRPYYYLLFRTHFEKISAHDISKIDTKYKKAEFRRLENQGCLHVEAMSERAKWVFVKKSSDKKETIQKRRLIQETFKSYCGALFLDEAQDINDDVYEILLEFDKMGIEINVMGDPKQDLRGYDNLRKLIKLYPDSVTYINDCFRCPKIHLILSNSLVVPAERQKSKSSMTGSLSFAYENDIEVKRYIEEQKFTLMYISEKNDRFDTHRDNDNVEIKNLMQELNNIFRKTFPDDDEKKLHRASYYFAEVMKEELMSGIQLKKVINHFVDALGVRLATDQYAKVASALKMLALPEDDERIVVSSIEAIKGMEADNCLFILTPDLAPYLLQKKTDDNKVKHKLYVALTRSRDRLSILITKETEEKFGRKCFDSYFSAYKATNELGSN